MTRQIKNTTLFLLCLFWGLDLWSQTNQDLFTEENSAGYAKHLFNKGDYELSFEEYKRLVFLDSSNVFYKTSLLKSAYKANTFKKGIKEARGFYKSDSLFPKPVAKEFTYLLLNSGYTRRSTIFLNANATFSSEDRSFYLCSSSLLDYDLIGARNFYSNFTGSSSSLKIQNLGVVLNEAEQFKPKSKLLAGVLSTVVPGTGKVYSGQWKDGVFALLYTSLSGYQAYRGFKRNGVKSVYGWAFASISTGFYLGNIYGSVKSIVKRRETHRASIIQQTKNVLASSY